MGKRKSHGITQYRVRWKGYGKDDRDDTWLTLREMTDAMQSAGDYETATTILNIFGVESGTAPEGFADQQKRLINGWFGYPLIGTPEQVVEQFLEIKKTGLEGMCLSFLDYNEELKYFDDRVMPLMKQAGLRI